MLLVQIVTLVWRTSSRNDYRSSHQSLFENDQEVTNSFGRSVLATKYFANLHRVESDEIRVFNAYTIMAILFRYLRLRKYRNINRMMKYLNRKTDVSWRTSSCHFIELKKWRILINLVVSFFFLIISCHFFLAFHSLVPNIFFIF